MRSRTDWAVPPDPGLCLWDPGDGLPEGKGRISGEQKTNGPKDGRRR